MKKSMYSLILMDDLVKEVDRLAHECGTSRSNYINRLLAERLAIMTPETRVAEVFGHITRVAGERPLLQFEPQPSGSMLVVRGVLNFKYNPAIRYSIELAVTGGFYGGELRVVSRSQSGALLTRLSVFYELWSQIEETCLHERFSGVHHKYAIAGGRYRRGLLALPAEDSCDPKELGESIGMYLALLDTVLALYFGAENGVDMETYNTMMKLYRDYLDETPEVV